MRMPRRAFDDRSGSLEEMVEDAHREDQARARHACDFDLGELMLQVRSHDSFSKGRVRRCIPARNDEELVRVIERLMGQAHSAYPRLRMQWQRQLVGYLTSLAAEALARLGNDELDVPPGFDYVGMEAIGSEEVQLRIRTEEAGDYGGLRARYLNLRAGRIGDHCFTHSRACHLSAGKAGHFLGEHSQGMRLRVGEAGDWLLLKSRDAAAELHRVGRLAGLDSHDMEIRVDHATYELGARASNAVIYVYRSVLTMGLSGSGVVYLAPEVGPVRTCFEVRPL
jgi:hypothetical protein